MVKQVVFFQEGKTLTVSAEVFRLVAARTQNIEAAELAHRISTVALDYSTELANSLGYWAIRRMRTYAQVKGSYPSTEGMAPIFPVQDDEVLHNMPYVEVLLDMGRHLISDLLPADEYLLSDLAQQFSNNLGSEWSKQKDFFEQLLKISIAGLASYSTLHGNHWWLFVDPILWLDSKAETESSGLTLTDQAVQLLKAPA